MNWLDRLIGKNDRVAEIERRIVELEDNIAMLINLDKSRGLDARLSILQDTVRRHESTFQVVKDIETKLNQSSPAIKDKHAHKNKQGKQ